MLYSNNPRRSDMNKEYVMIADRSIAKIFT